MFDAAAIRSPRTGTGTATYRGVADEGVTEGEVCREASGCERRVVVDAGEHTRESLGGAQYAGFHPQCRWNVSLADVEAEEKENAEFERTLQKLVARLRG